MQLFCICGKFMGELVKGKIRKHGKVICWECQDEVTRLREEVINATSKYTKNDMPDFMKNIFS